MRESKLAALLRSLVRARGGVCVTLMPTEAGVPDRMVLLDGQIYLVELKSASGSLRPAQLAWHSRAAHTGVNVVVLKGRQAIEDWVQEL